MRRLVPMLVMFLLAACGGDSSATAPKSDDILGTYSLKTVNGSPLPVAVQLGGVTYTLMSDVIVIGGNGTWTESYSTRHVVNGSNVDETASDAGTWSRTGASVTLKSSASGGSAYVATYANGTISFTIAGLAQVYSR